MAVTESGQRRHQSWADERRVASTHEAQLMRCRPQTGVKPAERMRIRHAILHDPRLEIPERPRILHRHDQLIRHGLKPLKQMFDERGVSPRQERFVPAHAPALTPCQDDSSHSGCHYIRPLGVATPAIQIETS